MRKVGETLYESMHNFFIPDFLLCCFKVRPMRRNNCGGEEISAVVDSSSLLSSYLGVLRPSLRTRPGISPQASSSSPYFYGFC